ncbi:MAG: triose-phosphate isomerase family protein, partial [bacterium]
NQLEQCFKGIELSDGKRLVLAYEPVWAIGTGLNATAEQAEEVQGFIREWLKNRYGAKVSEEMRIQYGGSLKPENAKEIFSMPNVDGGLVGGASLNAESFVKIVLAAKEAKC